MTKERLCTNCNFNNNGWCDKRKTNKGLRDLTECEYREVELIENPVEDINWNYILKAISHRIQNLENAKDVYTLRNDLAIQSVRDANLEIINKEIEIYKIEYLKILVKQQKSNK